MKLKAHFGTQADNNNENYNKNKEFKPATNKTWEPQYTHHTVKTFLEAVEKDLNNSTSYPINSIAQKQNLSKAERTSLQKLRNRDDIIITKADKGGAIVILDVEDYIAEAERQLNDTTSYEKLGFDPTPIYNQIINNNIDNLAKKSEITTKVSESLKNDKPKTPKFYMLPKIHKANNPGRPVVNSIDSHTSNISKYVDFHLQPLAQQLPSYIKDTSHFLRKLNTVNDTNSKSILVTLDVKSLYTNIPNDEGITAVRNAISNSPNNKISTKVIMSFLWLILTLSNFVFNGINYLQKQGVTMGSICSPSYANIFMGFFESKYIYPIIRGKCKLYTRYIDDIFLIWHGTEKELTEFFKKINNFHHTIKFDPKYSFTEINFLDTVVYKDNKYKLQTKVYHKPTDRTSLLHYKSEHPSGTKTSIIYSQALRIKRICSETIEMLKEFTILKEKLLTRGYSEHIINFHVNKTYSISRDELLREKQLKKNTTKLPFITTYNKTLPNIRSAIENHWNTLQINNKISELFQDKPVIAYRRNKNLSDLIGVKNIVNNKAKCNIASKGSSAPCNRGYGSKCCKYVNRTTTFTSSNTGKRYNIREVLNCKMTWLIYLLTCKKCSIQYIGKSEWPFNQRLNKHRFDVTDINAQEADKHFNQPQHIFERDAKFTLIEKIKNLEGDKEIIRKRAKIRENFWIKELKTIHPHGLNTYMNRV